MWSTNTNIRHKSGKTYKNIQTQYEWNENTKKYCEVEKDFQNEIDTYNGMDLKTMLSKNILPTLDQPPQYGDTTYRPKTIHDLKNAFDIIDTIDEIEANKPKAIEPVEPIAIEPVEPVKPNEIDKK